MIIQFIQTLLVVTLLTSEVFASEKIVLPPKPVESENLKTVLGIDSNRNDVRDDVEILIYNNISKNEEEYYAYLQLARGHQRYLKYFHDKKKLHLNEMYKNQTLDCFKVLGLKKITSEANNKISRMTFNSDVRKKMIRAYGPMSSEISATYVIKSIKEIKKEEVCEKNF